MKKFIIKGMVLGSIFIGLYFFAQYNLTKNYVDEYYSKFTYPSSSLILGISRAHDAIAPSVLEKHIGGEHMELPMLNFAFHLSQSPYGPVYYEAIQKKIKPGTKKGIFIVSVTPGSISIPSYLDDNAEKFSDQYSILAKMEDMNSSPNFEYIRKAYGKSLYKAFVKRTPDMRTAHEDGWMEVDLHTETFSATTEDVDKWKNQIIESYKGYEGFYKFSEIRFAYLGKIIELLKQHGRVFLVRIPVDKEILDLENQFLPDFNDRIEKLATESHVPYWNYTSRGIFFESYDGAHLSKEGAIAFSELLADDINSFLKK